jgi:glycosyltransferase involved in cell wall biosynthesis
MATAINQPLVSVAMVVRNVERFLAEAVESILNQTFADFEFIILDFGFTDLSKTIASDYASRDSRIRLHEISECGIADARNAACFLARGQYIAIQDADDMSLQDRLLSQVDFMEKHPDIGLLGGAAEWVNSRANPLWVINFPTEDCEIRSAFSTRFPFSQTAWLMRREAFVAVGGYRNVFTQSEDYDLALRISEQFHCANLNKIAVKYRIHSNQMSLYRRKEQTMCWLAAKASAVYRRMGRSDLLNAAATITPEVLASLNVSQAELRVRFFSDYRDWIENMCAAQEYSAVLEIAEEVLRSNWEYVNRREIADLQLLVARIRWKQKQFLQSFAATLDTEARAVAKHFGKSLLRRVVRCIEAGRRT